MLRQVAVLKITHSHTLSMHNFGGTIFKQPKISFEVKQTAAVVVRAIAAVIHNLAGMLSEGSTGHKAQPLYRLLLV